MLDAYVSTRFWHVLTSTSWTPDKYAYESTIQGYDMSGYDMSVISRGDESHESNNVYPG